MKLQRFFVRSTLEEDQTCDIPSLELVNQLKNVFRMRSGDTVILFDNSGYDFSAQILGYDRETVSFKILGKQVNTVHPERETYLLASLVKKDTFEWIVEKATELGVSHIIPLISDRTEKKDINEERLVKIIVEASEQSGRGTVPKLYPVHTLDTALAQFSELKSIVWEPSAERFANTDLDGVQAVYIGPEGGWTPQELEKMKTHGLIVRSLGPQILRAETAVVAGLAKIVF